MGVERIRALAASLVAGGLDAATPVGMVRWGTTGRQQSIEGTLATIADLVVEKKIHRARRHRHRRRGGAAEETELV